MDRIARAALALTLLAFVANVGDPLARGGPANDLCVNAAAISGPGLFSFNNAAAGTDGFVACGVAGNTQISRDLWWLWTASCDGEVTIATCNLTQLNTKIAVYAPLAPCPPTTAFLLGCNDDFCDERSSVSFLAIAGQQYLLRVGVSGAASGGAGAFRVACVASVVCSGVHSICQESGAGLGVASSHTARVADNFTVPASGVIAALCWRGGASTTFNDSFVVRYWRDSGGRPSGMPIASFQQSAGTLLVRKTPTGSILPNGFAEQDYSAAHAPVPLEAGVTYWVEIRNPVFPNMWFWAAGSGGDGVALYDTSPSDGSWTNLSAPNNPGGVVDDRAVCLAYESSCRIDTNDDGVIDFRDMNNILSFLNTTCP